MKIYLTLLASFISSFASLSHLYAQHSHAYAGGLEASDEEVYLAFINNVTGTAAALAPRSMAFSTATNPDTGVNYANAGFNFNGAWTPTALSSNGTYGMPYGTNIKMVLHSVQYSGHSGSAKFAIFDLDLDNPVYEDGLFAYYPSLSSPSVVMNAGTTGGTDGIMLTDPLFFDFDGDAYGHLHGRRFAANAVGTYTVTWALVNLGMGGGNSLDNPDVEYQTFSQTWNVIPEPSALFLMAIAGGIGMYCLRSRKKNC